MKWPSHRVNGIKNPKVILVWNSRRCVFSHVNTHLKHRVTQCAPGMVIVSSTCAQPYPIPNTQSTERGFTLCLWWGIGKLRCFILSRQYNAAERELLAFDGWINSKIDIFPRYWKEITKILHLYEAWYIYLINCNGTIQVFLINPTWVLEN